MVIILYVSLLARGIWIAKLCDSRFAQIAVGGLTMLITSQAFLHMMINVDLGPLTGQTLPLVSHGNGAFLSFCVAFGVILSISRMANKKIREEEAEAKHEEHRACEEARQGIAKGGDSEMEQEHKKDDRHCRDHRFSAFFKKEHPYPLLKA